MGHVITIAQQKGGSGKTTIAVNLALAFREMGRSVAVLDIDPQGSLGRWFMTRRERLDDPGLDFATSSAWGTAYECEKLRKINDIVIVDTPPKIDADLRPALRGSDLVLVPVSASHLDLWATEAVLELADRERRTALVILNRITARARVTAEVAEGIKALSAPQMAATLGNRVVYADALGKGLGVTEMGRTSPAAKEVLALATEVAKHLD